MQLKELLNLFRNDYIPRELKKRMIIKVPKEGNRLECHVNGNIRKDTSSSRNMVLAKLVLTCMAENLASLIYKEEGTFCSRPRLY